MYTTNHNTIMDEYLKKPGERIKPSITVEDVPKLIDTHYGFTVQQISECNGYDDRNFYVEVLKNNGEKGKYTFKVLNSLDTKKPGHSEAQNCVMKFLKSKGVNCPFPETSVNGNDYEVITWESDTGSTKHVIRLLAFVEGVVMHDVMPTPSLLENAGEYISQIEVHLQEFHHTALDNHSSIWMMDNLHDLKNFLYVIRDDQEKFDTVISVLNSFEEKVVPAYPKLQKGILHGDFNEQNILVGPVRQGMNEYKIVGLIDFGDMNLSFYVFELAITMCYMMLECLKSNDIDPILGSSYVLAGYRKHRKVSDDELGLLRTLIAGRLCQSLVLGTYTYTLDPGNEYLLTTTKTGWNLLFRLWNDTTNDELCKIWGMDSVK